MIKNKTSGNSGQTMIFMVMMLIILVFVVLWNLDLHKILYLKSQTQNAGDASALAAARWQGVTLNLVGDLNIMLAAALCSADAEASEQISELQRRLCYVGPVLGLMASQQAAKNNGIYINHAFTDRLVEHAYAVMEDYSEIFAEPFEGCWEEYGQMLLAVAGEGIAAGPDNARLYTDYAGGHMLLRMDFYDAIAARDWCWFLWNDYTLLETYTDYLYWPSLPPMIPESDPENSEIFGLGLTQVEGVLEGGDPELAFLNDVAEDRGLNAGIISNEVFAVPCVWMIYDTAEWGPWTAFSTEEADPFPAAGIVRPQYDYAGADAAIRIEAAAERLAPGAAGTRITWTAAAKPFGSFEDADATPSSHSLVLPVFHDVRLIPVDTSSAPEGGSYNLDWREHIEIHLPLYLFSGLSEIDADCWYCRQLITWEDVDDIGFRQQGIDWLAATNAVGDLLNPCESPGGPGYEAGGGRRRAH